MDDSTVALNMTFLMTLGIGFLIFLAHVLIFTTMLMLAGAAHLAALTFTALWNRLRMAEVTNHRSRPARDQETRPATAFPKPESQRGVASEKGKNRTLRPHEEK
ncbi:MAG TPA: hypothetical protein VIM08_08785 [Arthrobacter sp.]|jgi:hypothetical protein